MKGNVTIITGASSGIGKALAFEFGSKGHRILITGRKKEPLEATVAELKKAGIDAQYFQGDVSQQTDCEQMASFAIQAFGKIDNLIANAGISMRATFEEVEPEVVKKVMDINFWGAFFSAKACLKEIIKNKGSIIGISSIAGFRGLPGRVGYSASKFALQGLLETLRTEMLYKGVHVMTVCPGFTASNIRNTALNEKGNAQGESPRNEQKMMSAEECAAHIYKAAQKRKAYLVLTSQGKLTVFLNKFFPRFMDKMVFKAMAKEPGAPFKVGE